MLRFLRYVLHTFLPSLSMCQGLWLGSVLPGQVHDLMLISIIGTLMFEALLIGLLLDFPPGIRLAAYTVSVMLMLPVLALYTANMPAFEAVGGWVLKLVNLNLFLLLATALVALCAAIGSVKDLSDRASRRRAF